MPRHTVTAITEDPPDKRALEVAVEGHVGAVMSGDGYLLALEMFEGIPILTAAAFCRK